MTTKKLYRLFAAAGLIIAAARLNAQLNIILEAGALGFANAAINDGSTLDSDIAGKLVTGPTGQGSILTIQTNGQAGPGTGTDPLLVTVTAKTHLDNTNIIGDYQAGVIYMTAGTGTTPKAHGLGVRAFTVNTTTGLRAPGANPAIEGSKEVSGGTDPTPQSTNLNGPPHVDELVDFNFNPALKVFGSSIVVTLTTFDGVGTTDFGNLNGSQDVFDLVIHRAGGLGDLTFNSISRSTFTSQFTQI